MRLYLIDIYQQQKRNIEQQNNGETNKLACRRFAMFISVIKRRVKGGRLTRLSVLSCIWTYFLSTLSLQVESVSMHIVKLYFSADRMWLLTIQLRQNNIASKVVPFFSDLWYVRFEGKTRTPTPTPTRTRIITNPTNQSGAGSGQFLVCFPPPKKSIRLCNS